MFPFQPPAQWKISALYHGVKRIYNRLLQSRIFNTTVWIPIVLLYLPRWTHSPIPHSFSSVHYTVLDSSQLIVCYEALFALMRPAPSLSIAAFSSLVGKRCVPIVSIPFLSTAAATALRVAPPFCRSCGAQFCRAFSCHLPRLIIMIPGERRLRSNIRNAALQEAIYFYQVPAYSKELLSDFEIIRNLQDPLHSPGPLSSMFLKTGLQSHNLIQMSLQK